MGCGIGKHIFLNVECLIKIWVRIQQHDAVEAKFFFQLLLNDFTASRFSLHEVKTSKDYIIQHRYAALKRLRDDPERTTIVLLNIFLEGK